LRGNVETVHCVSHRTTRSFIRLARLCCWRGRIRKMGTLGAVYWKRALKNGRAVSASVEAVGSQPDATGMAR
jgi:hypothetical protein